MSELTEEEILVKAREIEDNQRKQKELEKEQQLEKTMQSLIGKFYKTLDYTDDKKKFYRVFTSNWRDTEVQVETWHYYHDHHYAVHTDRWYADNRSSYDEEISEIEFLQAVSWWMKKVGVYQIMTQETDH